LDLFDNKTMCDGRDRLSLGFFVSFVSYTHTCCLYFAHNSTIKTPTNKAKQKKRKIHERTSL